MATSFDNTYVLDFDKAIDLIKTYFKTHFTPFILVKEYDLPTGYWGITYSTENDTISINCGRGYLEYQITLSGQTFDLVKFDSQMERIKVASKNNILFLLDTVKRVLTNKNLA